MIKYFLKRANIDFDVITFEKPDGIYKGILISGPDRVPVIVAVNQTAPENNSILFSVNGEDSFATVSENGTVEFRSQQTGDIGGFLCIFQAILKVVDTLQGCAKDDTICILDNLILFVKAVIACTAV